jgi:hypothetical protein
MTAAAKKAPSRAKPEIAERAAVANAYIVEHWGKLRLADIGEAIGMEPKNVGKRARKLGLPLLVSGRARGGAVAVAIAASTPEKPKGFTSEQLKWAEANAYLEIEATTVDALRASINAKKEARMILAMNGEDMR